MCALALGGALWASGVATTAAAAPVPSPTPSATATAASRGATPSPTLPAKTPTARPTLSTPPTVGPTARPTASPTPVAPEAGAGSLAAEDSGAGSSGSGGTSGSTTSTHGILEAFRVQGIAEQRGLNAAGDPRARDSRGGEGSEKPAPVVPAGPRETGEIDWPSVIPRSMRVPRPAGAQSGATRGAESPSGAPSLTAGPTPTLVPIRYAGVPAASADASWLSPSVLWLGIPHRSQFDESVYAQTNCGPASLGMILEAYGLRGYPTDAIRGEVNRLQGNSDPDSGTALSAIAAVAERAGLFPIDLYNRNGFYRRWTVDELRASVTEGRPIITLVRYAELPGNGDFDPRTDHYIVLSGISGDHFIYNDSAYARGAGRGLLISRETLQRAWENSSIPGHAVALALNARRAGLLQPHRLAELQKELSADESLGANESADTGLDRKGEGEKVGAGGPGPGDLDGEGSPPAASAADRRTAPLASSSGVEVDLAWTGVRLKLGIFTPLVAPLAPGIVAAFLARTRRRPEE